MGNKHREKSFHTKKELMTSAIRLFGEKGFVATTVQEIAYNAGYAKGNFYRYWRSKDDIFLEIMENRLKEYRDKRKEGLEKARNIQDIINVIVDFLETIIDDKNWSKVFLEFTIYGFGKEELKKKLNKSNYRLSSDLFAEILRPFYEDTNTTKKLGSLLIALFEGFLIQQSLDNKLIDKKDLRKAILILSRYFLK